MFNNVLNGLTLTGEYSNEVFPNITGSYCDNDLTFLATLRALLPGRMPEGTEITFCDESLIRRMSDYKDTESRDVVIDVLSNFVQNDALTFVMLRTDTETTEFIFKCFDESLSVAAPDFTELKDLRAFVKRNGDVMFLINPSTKQAIILCSVSSIRMFHLVQSLTSRLLPWFFENKPLTEEEKELVCSLRSKTSNEYEEIIEKFAQKYDFNSIRVEKLLSNFLTAEKTARIDRITNDISGLNHSANEYLESYKNLLKDIQELEIKKFGLLAMINNVDDDKQLVQYFKNNKHVQLVNTYGSSISFIAWNYLSFWDNDLYERYRTQFSGYLYDNGSVLSDPNERLKLYDAIFGFDAKIKIKLCGYYNLDLVGRVNTESNFDYPKNYKNMMPNPHLQRHSCLGNYADVIREKVANNDVVGAVECCLASVSQINMAEGATFPHFVNKLFAKDCGKVLELPDGTEVTPSEAYEWLINQ